MLVHPDTKSPHIVQGKEGKRPVFSTQIFSKSPFCIFVRQIHVHKYFLTFGHIATKVGYTEIVDEQWRWVVFIISFVSPWCTHTSKVILSLACLFDISISNNSNTAASKSGANYSHFIAKNCHLVRLLQKPFKNVQKRCLVKRCQFRVQLS